MAVKDQLITDRCALYNGDACEVLPGLPAGSAHLSVYSPPFGGMLYQYSSDPADLSNTKDYAEFFEHYGFVVREIHRLTLPGRMTAVHCQDVAVTRGNDHHLIDFPGDIVRCHEANGWKYVARYHVWKEPLTVRNRTMVKSLHHKTLCEDSTRCSAANADYLLVFRRSGKNEIPVAHPCGLTRYAGSRQPPADVLKWRGYKGSQIKNEYSHWVWRQYASAFWDDVRIDRTLGSGASLYSANKADKDEPDEKHMHPLQLDVVERAVVLWSNPGEVVLTPFMGVGSEVYGALVNGRKGVGVELKPSFYLQALKNVRAALEDSPEQADLFAGLGADPEAAPAPEPALPFARPAAPTWDAPCKFSVSLETGKLAQVTYEGPHGPLGPGALRISGPGGEWFASHTPGLAFGPEEGEALEAYAERAARHHFRAWAAHEARAEADRMRQAKGKKKARR